MTVGELINILSTYHKSDEIKFATSPREEYEVASDYKDDFGTVWIDLLGVE